MPVAAQYIPAAYSLTAVGVWGSSDFLGGVGARRVNAFLFTAIAHISGLVVIGALALIAREPFLANSSVVWSLISGAVGGMALALFYRSLASGKMGLLAPVAAVLGAAIPGNNTLKIAAHAVIELAASMKSFEFSRQEVWSRNQPDFGGHLPHTTSAFFRAEPYQRLLKPRIAESVGIRSRIKLLESIGKAAHPPRVVARNPTPGGELQAQLIPGKT